MHVVDVLTQSHAGADDGGALAQFDGAGDRGPPRTAGLLLGRFVRLGELRLVAGDGAWVVRLNPRHLVGIAGRPPSDQSVGQVRGVVSANHHVVTEAVDAGKNT